MEVTNGSTEEKIISASFHIIIKEGISKATTKKIAETAGVSEITLFRKFKNKKQLIKTVKEYYGNMLITRLEEIFEFRPEMSIEEYFNHCINGINNLNRNETDIIKIWLGELNSIENRKNLTLEGINLIINKIKDFISLKLKQNKIRKVNLDILALNMFSIILEYSLLWKIFNPNTQYKSNKYTEDFLDILINGIKSD